MPLRRRADDALSIAPDGYHDASLPSVGPFEAKGMASGDHLKIEGRRAGQWAIVDHDRTISRLCCDADCEDRRGTELRALAPRQDHG